MKTFRTLLSRLPLALLLLVALVVSGSPPVQADDPIILRDAYTVASLPTCNSGAKYRIALVTDGDDAADCTSGGTSTYAWCGCNGTSWVGLATLFDYSGTLAAASTMAIDVGGTTDELTITTGKSTFLGTVIMSIGAAPPAACAAGTKGSVYYDSDINKLCVCNGTNFVLINDDSTTTGCS